MEIIALDTISTGRYHSIRVIRNFHDEESEKVFLRERSRRLPINVQGSAQRKLVMLDAAETLQDLRGPPGNRLEMLSGLRAGQYSIRVNSQWRVCFRWADGDAYKVEITDYH